MDDLTNNFTKNSIGVCERLKTGEVIFQNSVCLRLCGNWLGQSCTIGCRKSCTRSLNGEDYGFTVLKDIHRDSTSIVDAVKLVNTNNEYTFLVDKSEIYLKLMNQLLEFNASKMEIEVYSLVLRGYSNTDIAKKLFISRNTVRSHINNLRKKIPKNVFAKRNNSKG